MRTNGISIKHNKGFVNRNRYSTVYYIYTHSDHRNRISKVSVSFFCVPMINRVDNNRYIII